MSPAQRPLELVCGPRHAQARDADQRPFDFEDAKGHWEAWLDVRVPALNHKTPRHAARTAVGRERLEALLGAFERTAASGPPGVAAHLARVRSALALNRPLT